MKFYEIEFSNEPGPLLDDETSEYSICILGERMPSIEEATTFCKSDLKKLGYKYVCNVLEISEHEAMTFFDMENMANFPVFT